jgi:general secretion pathway protein D
VLPPAGAFGPIAAGLTAFTFQTDRFFAILNALASQDKINVISSPHVLTSENKKAVINVSTSIPIVTSQAATLGGIGTTGTGTTPTVVGQQTIEYRDAGVILTVTPRIGERGTVALDVKQEVNDIGGPEPPTGSRRINKREAETSVVLVNNQTLVLGGLITDRREFIRRGIPLLRDIPILGYLFGFTEQILDKRELLILITPRVLGTALDAAKITEQMRRATPDLDQAIRQAPRPPTTAPPPDAPAPAPAPATPPAPAPAPSQ